LSDSATQRFTGKERDSESGLDYFLARFYGSSLGRFASADDGSDQQAGDPQSWNLYSYVRNGPLDHVDPDGHDCETGTYTMTNSDGKVVQQFTFSDSSSCGWDFWTQAVNYAQKGLDTAVQTVQSVNHAVNSVNWPCVSSYTGAGMATGAVTGGTVGLIGSVTGPGELVIEPASIMGGAALGGATGLAMGLNSCMSSNSGAGGGSGGPSLVDSIKAIKRGLDRDDRIAAIRNLLQRRSTWTVVEEDLGDTHAFSGARGEAIFIDENGSVWKGTMSGYREGSLGTKLLP
jgi:RHS repeat-associated protein